MPDHGAENSTLHPLPLILVENIMRLRLMICAFFVVVKDGAFADLQNVWV